MIRLTDLQTSLLDLLQEIKGTEIKLIVGGGFGIYLKIDHVIRTGARTLFQQRPEPRSTNDLDLFLRPELLIESEKLKPLAKAISKLGYQVVRGAEKYQFVKAGPVGGVPGSIRIDILTGPREDFTETRVKVDARRARPKPSVGIHAHPVDEAPTLEKGLISVLLEGRLGSNLFHEEVLLPHPFTFLMMKLFAFRDRLDDENKSYGQYHALDLYTILSVTTEPEWKYALELRDQFKDAPHVVEAGDLVFRYFSSLDRLGIIRLKESSYYRPGLQLNDFISAFQELFPKRTIR